jgi:3',5'-nucleoside bisphosphate phosphatase
MKKVDLHVHSYITDGSYTPAGLAKLAKERGIAAFALTDHDSIEGMDEAAAAAERLGVGFMTGMEMSVDYKEARLHVLALDFDAQHPAFQSLYKRIRAMKEAKMAELIRGIARRGVPISEELVAPYALTAIDRYAIMRYLVSLKLYDHVQLLWDNVITPVTTALGINYNVTAEEALPAVHKAGGVTSLAHYHKKIGLGALSRSAQEKTIVHLLHLGLDGMERWYPNYTSEDADFAGQMILKYKMLPTGGTDFHGANRPGIEMGTGWKHNMNVPYVFYENILQRKSAKIC